MPLTAIVFVCTLWQAASRPVPPPPVTHPLAEAIERWTRRGDAVLVLSTAIDPAQPLLVQMDRRPGSRYSCTYPAAMLYWPADPARPPGTAPYRHPADAPPEERQFLDDLTADVRARAPKLIAVDAEPGCQGCTAEFNLLDYLRYNGWWDQNVGPNYVEAGQAGKFRLYVRR